jgi:AcrR family transcriptional regulator
MAVRAQQKERTRRALIDAALGQISAERGFTNLSLREVAREAGIAPTSFYRHFPDLEALGLALVDEAGTELRRRMREARRRFGSEGGVVRASVETFIQFLTENANLFYLLSRERAVGSPAFRRAIRREIDHFVDELACDLERECRDRGILMSDIPVVAETMVTIVFNNGLELIDRKEENIQNFTQKMVQQLRMISMGAEAMARREYILAEPG